MSEQHPRVQQILAGPRGPGTAAFFDFDGTIVDGYSVGAIYQERLRNLEMSPMELLQLVVASAQSSLDEQQFTDMATRAARSWEGREERDLMEMGRRLLVQRIGETLFLDAWEVVKAHQRMGHTVVVASAASRFQVEPLAEDLGVEHVLCTRFETVDGMLTGRLDGAPLWGARKAEAVVAFAEEHDLDLSQAHAYGNGEEDIAFLQTVGHPHAVNPQGRLKRHAEEHGWDVVRFEGRGRPDPFQLARSLATYATIAAAGGLGLGVSVVNRDRRQGVDVASGLMGDLSLAVAGVDLDVRGTEHLWSHRPAVFLFNHQSGIDMPVMAKLVRERFTGVAKAELKRLPVFGQLFRWADVAFVDRSNSAKAREALAPVVEKLRQGISIIIAPEGTRSPTPALGRFKKGAFHLAMQAEVPIVPVVSPGTIDVVVHPPIDVSAWTVDELDERVAEVHQLYVDTLTDWPRHTEAG